MTCTFDVACTLMQCVGFQDKVHKAQLLLVAFFTCILRSDEKNALYGDLFLPCVLPSVYGLLSATGPSIRFL